MQTGLNAPGSGKVARS